MLRNGTPPGNFLATHRLVPESSGPASDRQCRCPACEHDLEPYRVQGVEIDVCMKCGGIWLDAGEFDRVRQRYRRTLRSGEPDDRERSHDADWEDDASIWPGAGEPDHVSQRNGGKGRSDEPDRRQGSDDADWEDEDQGLLESIKDLLGLD